MKNAKFYEYIQEVFFNVPKHILRNQIHYILRLIRFGTVYIPRPVAKMLPCIKFAFEREDENSYVNLFIVM